MRVIPMPAAKLAMDEPEWLGDGGYRHPDNPDCNYLSTMNGTSSAAPSVSGAIALVLEVNPDLSYREVKHIIAATARQVDATFAPVIIDGISYHEWRMNSAGYHHHNWYGFGAIDAESAVTYAENWDTSVYPFNAQEVSSGPTRANAHDCANNDGSESSVQRRSQRDIRCSRIRDSVSILIPHLHGWLDQCPVAPFQAFTTHRFQLYDGSAIYPRQLSMVRRLRVIGPLRSMTT